jgi:hypothetical protein
MPIETKSFVGRRCRRHFCKARDCRRFLPAAGSRIDYHCLRTNDSRSSQQRDTTRNRGAGASGPAENTIPLGGEDSSRGTWHMQKHACTSSPLRPTFVCDINDISGYAPWHLFFFSHPAHPTIIVCIQGYCEISI